MSPYWVLSTMVLFDLDPCHHSDPPGQLVARGLVPRMRQDKYVSRI